MYYFLNAKIIILPLGCVKKFPFLHPVFWCDYVAAKLHPNIHKSGSLYYELYYWKGKKKIHSYQF